MVPALPSPRAAVVLSARRAAALARIGGRIRGNLATTRDALVPAGEFVARGQHRVDDWLAGRWRWLLLAFALVAQTLGAYRVLSKPGHPRLRDSVIFEYVGWSFAHGATLYVEVFEVKPPLSYETAALLSLLAGDDQLLYHQLCVALTAVAAVVAVVLAGELAFSLTGEPAAALAAGLTPYLVPQFALRAGFGFKAKYFVLATALLAIWLARRDRHGLAGVAAAASVGYWQVAVVVPVVVLGMAVQRGRRAVAFVVVGGGVASLLILSPVLLAGPGAVVAMLNQTVLVTQYAAQSGSPLGHALRVLALVRWADALVLAGVVGLVLAAFDGEASDEAGDEMHDEAGNETGDGTHPVADGGRTAAASIVETVAPTGRAWWAAACGAWFVGVVLAFDLDAAPDLFVSLGFLGLGVAVVAARFGPALRGTVLALAVATAVVNVAFMGGFGVVAQPFQIDDEPPAVADPSDVDAPYSNAEHNALLWHGIPAETCHVFYGPTQRAWVEAVGGSEIDDRCRTTFP